MAAIVAQAQHLQGWCAQLELQLQAKDIGASPVASPPARSHTCVASLPWVLLGCHPTWQHHAVCGVHVGQLSMDSAQLHSCNQCWQHPPVRMVLTVQLRNKALAAERALAAGRALALNTINLKT